jgi:FKBP-type peptidyl-prolyl cis-trans isomerase FkpA
LLTFAGSASIDTLTEILGSVTFDNQNNRAPLGARTINFAVSDGSLITNQSVVIDVIASLSATISTSATLLSFTETDAATTVDPDVTIVAGGGSMSDIIASASVRFSAGFVASQDVLEFDPVAGVSGSYDAAGGVLSFSGTANIDTYQSLLRSVRYSNAATGTALVTGDRTLEFGIVNNGVQATATRDLRVSAASDERLIQNYLDANSLTSEKTASGLHYIVEQEGNGNFPNANSQVTVNYKGFLLDGTMFDGADNATFSLQGVIAGWTEGIPRFSVGGKGQLLIPSALAYGSMSLPGIPANSVLRFEVELLSFV